MTPELRTAIYSAAVAVGAVFVVLKIITQDQLDLWLNLLGTILPAAGSILALFYRPTLKPLVEDTPTPQLEAEVQSRKGE